MSDFAYTPGGDSGSPSASTYMISSQFNTSYHHTSSDEDEITSLPSETSTESDFLSDYQDSDAEEQWRESLEQLELLLTMVLVPFIGKYAGRKCAYWGWAKFMEWQYPVEAVITNKAAFRSAGIIGAATL
ncbi:hypothetical protein TMatcc_010422 [Talaromyces marneffei ATCC 18224]|uniref:Uncharacterized protein n=2 Tax=Talaromyces marneffei TaxID=37727 RepID=B6QVM9_TALMQ|nr:uncharacterized protein EYB26_009786 [Talaromyces marneffei]EEA19034.1 conserved hypothetical protein [Talaromyces marneffei ATCC 18224]KAE8548728.1 hypothetical protein EYB25_009109 [Talaromyces marneffei]QGA22072.1 hypothetical protein EYB26_009786 [Talaromyces marneffei]